MTFTIFNLTYLLYFYEFQLFVYGIIMFENFLFHWCIPQNLFTTLARFLRFSRIYVNLPIITWSLSFVFYSFVFLYSIVWRFSVSDAFYFLGRLIWKIDKTFFTIFHLRFIWSLLSYRFDPAFWFTSAGTKCFGSSPITGFTLSASDLLLPLVVVYIITDLFDIVNSFFQLCEKNLCYFTYKLFRIDFSLQMV